MESLLEKSAMEFDFSGYVRMLHGLLGGKVKAADFMLALVDNIMEEPYTPEDQQSAQEDRYNPLAALSANALSKIYNGTRNISREGARAVVRRLDKEKFTSYILEAPVDTVAMLGTAMGMPMDSHAEDIARACTERLAQLLYANAKPAQKPSLVVVKGKEDPQAASGPHSDDLLLLMEAGGRCPACAKPLVGQKGQHSLEEYRVIGLTPEAAGNDGKIALCLSCANRYGSRTTPEDFSHLREMKARLRTEQKARAVMERMPIEEEIEQLIRRISCTPPDLSCDTLSYKALCIRQKIHGENGALIAKVEGYVMMYYRLIQSVFSQMEREGALNFNCVAEDVAACYRRLGSLGMTQEEIFSRLAQWFMDKTHYPSFAACEILVAFFVQNCEVFHAIAQ